MESVTGWAVEETVGATLWLMAGDIEAAVTALASGGTAGGACPGFVPMCSEVS